MISNCLEEGGACLSSLVCKRSQKLFDFSTVETMKHWKVQQQMMDGQC